MVAWGRKTKEVGQAGAGLAQSHAGKLGHCARDVDVQTGSGWAFVCCGAHREEVAWLMVQ